MKEGKKKNSVQMSHIFGTWLKYTTWNNEIMKKGNQKETLNSGEKKFDKKWWETYGFHLRETTYILGVFSLYFLTIWSSMHEYMANRNTATSYKYFYYLLLFFHFIFSFHFIFLFFFFCCWHLEVWGFKKCWISTSNLFLKRVKIKI